ncbi:hypothetical protein O181_070247 [Austropuccinia psidii MF-1]|uniref:Uncharacterized protein n=1 Tax=Austropuccinia psidii MF-1 TaxID=1389203 RepID=A0A9Q3I831_9BASI|nr:hypothetical protein [Austropuccinia psidii MF-1]
MVRQENIEAASTVTSIIPASTGNSDHNSTVIITQKNQSEPIPPEFINLDISNTLKKAKDLANNQEPAITPQAALKKVIDMIMAEANLLQKDKGQFMTSKLINYVILKLIILFYLQKELTPPQEASVDKYKASQKAYNNTLQHREYQVLADLWKNCMNTYLTVRKFPGHPNTCKLLKGWQPLMEKKNMILSTAEWRKNNPPPPKQVSKTAPVASSSNCNVKKAATSSKQGQRQGTSHKPLRSGPQNPKDSAGCHGKCISDVQNNDGITGKGGSQIKISEMIFDIFDSIPELYEAI